MQADDTSENLSLFADYSDGSAIDVSIDAVWTILTGDSDFIDIGTAVGEEGNVVLSSDIATITENKSIVVRAAYDGLNAYIEIVVETP